MKLKTSLFSICLFILSLQTLQAQTFDEIVKNRKVINDYAGIFSEQAVLSAMDSLVRYSNRTGNQIVIITLKQIPDNDDPINFAIRLWKQKKWKLGDEKNDNGVMVIITTEKPREFKIFPGSGLEGALPDVVIKRFFREEAVPRLKAGQFDEVLARTIYFICASTEGEYKTTAKKGDLSLSDFLVGGVILLVLFLVLSNISKRSNNGGNNLGGGSRKTRTSDTAAWPFLLPLIFGGGGHSGGSGWGGGGSSGGGFGGFSGGGGSFGGGGGGGSW
ncbi:MAG: TPM domain-containing protein [Bacteroidetes bacterium]|nr:TPM domain-containing protein [Bacteroidota bacterium]